VVKLTTERKHLTDIIKGGCLSSREQPHCAAMTALRPRRLGGANAAARAVCHCRRLSAFPKRS
jgi:hypothetical protein